MNTSKPLGLRLKIGFGLGHVLNDLAASIWFTYLLLYFHEVRPLQAYFCWYIHM
jgi:Na+/melibiose symporter-like transporter